MDFKNYLKKRLEKEKLLSVCQFMELALYHPDFGYYMKQNPLGDCADFVTSPEISQLFGEVLSLWAIEQYLTLQKPPRLAVIELGPGRGLLMSDFLRFSERFSSFQTSLEIHLVEISPVLQNIQQAQLTHPRLFWHSTIEQALEKTVGTPTLILANEFFDALPIEQYRRQNHIWHQRCVQLKGGDELEFCFRNINQQDVPLDIQFGIWQDNQIIEHHFLTENIVQKIVQYFNTTDGAALIIDYGYLKGHGDTLQGVSKHQYAKVLENPGTVDLSTHIDFGRLQEISKDASKIMTQRDFLLKYGLLELFYHYGQSANIDQRLSLEQQIYKLTSSQEMGNLFKVFEINSLSFENS